MGKHDAAFIEGHKINKLTFLGHDTPVVSPAGKVRPTVKLRCDCGAVVVKDRYAWLSGRQVSCGCHGEATRSERHHVHGMHGTKLYSSWASMKQRTTPGSAANQRGYVGVGRAVEWDTFAGFLANQPKGRSFAPGLQLARFGDTGDYTPDNCRWATKSENTQEMLARRKLQLPDGRFAADVARENGIPVATWEQRYYKMGIPIEVAVTVKSLRGHAAPPRTASSSA